MIDPEKDNAPDLESIVLNLNNLGHPDSPEEKKLRVDVKALQKKMQDLYYDFAGEGLNPIGELVREISDYRTEELEKYLLAYFGDVETAKAIGHFFVLEIEEDDPQVNASDGVEDNDIVYRFEMRYRLRRLRPDELRELGIKGSLFEAMLELEKKRATNR